MGRREPRQRRQSGRRLAAGPLVERRREREPECLLAHGGASWTIPPISSASDTGQAKLSRCAGGNAANGGDFERATDPWVSFSPNGVAHQVALGINDSNVSNAVLTSR